MKKISYYLIILTIFLTAACKKPLTIQDNEKTVEYAINTPFEIHLRTNPSTGYKWHIISYDSNIIRQTAKPEYQTDSDKTGTASTVIFKFETISAGSTTLRMVNSRDAISAGEDKTVFSLHIISGTIGRITAD